MRSGMGTKYGADVADPKAVGALKTGAVKGGKRKRRKVPANIKGLKTGSKKKG